MKVLKNKRTSEVQNEKSRGTRLRDLECMKVLKTSYEKFGSVQLGVL